MWKRIIGMSSLIVLSFCLLQADKQDVLANLLAPIAPNLEQQVEVNAKPTFEIIGVPDSFLESSHNQPFDFYVIADDVDSDTVTMTVTVSGGVGSHTETRTDVPVQSIQKFEVPTLYVNRTAIKLEVKVRDQQQNETIQQVEIKLVKNTQIAREHLVATPFSEGYLVGDELTLQRNVQVFASNQSQKICTITSELTINDQSIATIPKISLEAENSAALNEVLQANGYDRYTLKLPPELMDEGQLILKSNVTIETGQGNCDKPAKITGTGISVINIKRGKLTIEFLDTETQALIAAPYTVELDGKTYTNENGSITIEPIKSAQKATDYEPKLTIPATVPLKYSELIKSEVVNSDQTLTALPAQIQYKNADVHIRYYFGPINPLVGAITLGIDNNQFELDPRTDVTLAPTSLVTLGASFTLKHKPDALVISSRSEQVTPQLYQQTPDGLFIPLEKVQVIDWHYDSAKQQWLGTFTDSFLTLFPVQATPMPFYVRWTTQMPNQAVQTGIRLEPGPTSTNEALMLLQPYAEPENQGNANLPDLF